MMTRWVNHWVFTLNLSEKLYFLIFEKRICLNYFQNSRMVLSILCNNDKICERKKDCLSYSGINVSQSIIVSSNFFRRKNPLEFWENCCYSQRHANCYCSSGRSFSVLRRPKEDCLSHLALLSIECAYFNRVDIEKLFYELSSKKGCSKFFFQAIFRPKNIDDLFWIL